jgi:hypothetical protein
VPIAFGPLWAGYFTEMTEVFLADLGGEVTSRCQLQTVMARQAAKAVDRQDYGTDYRPDMFQSLNEILAGLWEEKEAMTGVPDDDLAYRVVDELDERIDLGGVLSELVREELRHNEGR